MSKNADVYRKPASFLIVSVLLGILGNVIPDGKGLALLVSLPGMVVSLAAIYFEYTAHAEIIAPYQWELSENWRMIWKWMLYSILGIFASIFLIMIIPVLGFLAMLGCMVLMIVAGVLKYVYLYRMVKLFEAYR